MAFSFKFSADGSEFTRGLQKMKGEVKSFAMSAGALMAGAFAGGKIISVMSQMVKSAKEINKQAQLFSTSSQVIQKFGKAAEASGFTLDNLADAMHDMTEKAQDAAQGNKTYAESFAMMGLDANDFMNLNFEEKVRAFGDGLKYASKSGLEFLAANDLAGGAAQELIGTFKDGGDEFFRLAHAQQAATDAQLNSALKVGRAWHDIKQLGMKVLVGFLEVLNDAGAGFAIQMTRVVESVRLVLTEIKLLSRLMESAMKGDWSGVTSSLRQMKEEGKKTFDTIKKGIDGIHEAKRTKGKRDRGGVSKNEIAAMKAAGKEREKTINSVAKLEKDIADIKAKAAFDALSMEGKRLEMIKRQAAAERAHKEAVISTVSLQMDSMQKHGDLEANPLYIKELEAQKEMFRVAKELAAVEASIAKSKIDTQKELFRLEKEKKATFNASMSATEKALSQESDGLKSELSQGQGNLENLKGQGVESSVITSGLRSIGGGGSAKVTRDPAMQIAKRSQSILAQIAKNTAIQAKVEVITAAQKELSAFNKEH